MANQKTSFWLTPQGLAALGLIGAATYFLLVEHRQHVLPFLPYLILLLCPLMHVFMHGGHGHGHGHRGHGDHNHSDRHGDESAQDAYRRGLEKGRREAGRQRRD